jgi:hypothetical protein
VDYVLVIFGGLSGYSSDDINKFLWMVRIGGGVFPQHIQEKNYLTDKVRVGGCARGCGCGCSCVSRGGDTARRAHRQQRRCRAPGPGTSCLRLAPGT